MTKCANVTLLLDVSDQSLGHRAGQLLSTGGGERTKRERLNGRKNTTAVVSDCHLPTGAAWREREKEKESISLELSLYKSLTFESGEEQF